MSNRTVQVARKVFAGAGICLLGTAALTLSAATPAGAKPPLVIRGIPGSAASTELQLAYQATFPNGSLEPQLDKLNVGAMVPGDPLIPDTNPTVSFSPGEAVLSVHRPLGLSADDFPSESLWATPVNFGPGSVVRISATFRAPVGPLPGGGFAIGLVARTGAKDDVAPANERIAITVNVRPGFLVRFGAAFGNVAPARVVLPDDVKNAIFSSTDPQPFTMDLTIDRSQSTATATAKLTVIDQVFTVPFALSDFLTDSGPAITAVGPGVAVNVNAPGQTASVHVRDFRIYANVGG